MLRITSCMRIVPERRALAARDRRDLLGRQVLVDAARIRAGANAFDQHLPSRMFEISAGSPASAARITRIAP